MQNVIYIVVMVLLQALIFNRIHIFGVAMPLAYVYYVVRMSRDTKPWSSMVICFILGVCIDIFSNSPGLAAASLTLLAFVRPKILERYLHKEDPDDFMPTLQGMGFMRYFSYIFPIVLLYCIILYALESFTFTHWYDGFLNVAGSLVLTLALILVVERVRS